VVFAVGCACCLVSGLAPAGTAAASPAAPPRLSLPGSSLPGQPPTTRFSHLAPKTPGALRTAAAPAGRGVASVQLDGIAGFPVANPETHTLYVPLQNRNLVDVIDTADCNSRVTVGCRVVARARAGVAGPHGGGPMAAVIDTRTDTVYVVNAPPTGAGSITVLNGARCNATVTVGCGHVIARR
jgi:DNA-binding beta-propeller fold protein YncE